MLVIKIIRCWILLLIIISTGCKKLVEVEAPFYTTNGGNVFLQDQTAIAALTGIYTQMSRSATFSGSGSMTMLAGLSADELTLFKDVTDTRFKAYFTNSLMSDGIQNFGTDAWVNLFQYIYYVNAAIEGLTLSSALTTNVKKQLMGEAKFLRAFIYFYLVNLYGDVPLILTTDYKVNALLARSTKSQVYQQMIVDLRDAKDLLDMDYLNGSLGKYSSLAVSERVRPNRLVAAALLARVYLYSKDYINAQMESTVVINQTDLYKLEPLSEVFKRNSNEAIWQLQPVNAGRNTEDAKAFVLTTAGPTTTTERPVFMSSQLLNSFEANDQRKSKWVDSVVAVGSSVKYFYPAKYKNIGSSVTEYLMVLRLGELYLIRAEARAQLGDIGGAQNDLNIIRIRSGLNQTSADNKNSLLMAIQHERQVELFTEWGHRWIDLIRTDNVDLVMSITTPLKSNNTVQWHSYQQLYPLPLSDIDKNPNLVQNPQY